MSNVERILPAAQQRLVTIGIDARLIDAARLLNDPRRGLVVVCDESGKLAGVITRSDIVGRISHCTGFSCTMVASTAMTRKVTFCRPADGLSDLWSVIKARGLQSIPVVDEDAKPVGVLNARDVLQILLEDAQHEEALLREYVMTVGYH